MSGDGEGTRSKKKNGTIIREMDIDDLATVFHMGEKLFTAHKVPNLYRTWDEFEVVDLYYSSPDFCLVAEHEEQVVGFALGTTIEKSHSAWKYGHLIWLGVDPSVQSKGVGEKLCAHIEELMHEDGVRILMVDTEADNTGAIKFFKRLGFGKPEEHVYLTMNLTGRKHKTSGQGRRRAGQTRDKK